MSNFIDFKEAVQRQLTRMIKTGLLVTDVDKDIMWKTYLESFPEGTNKIFGKRREYDCQCCKHFVRTFGNIVTITDAKVVSIWDCQPGGYFQYVSKAMSNLVKTATIKDGFFNHGKDLGTDFNHQHVSYPGAGQGVIKFDHFYFKFPEPEIVWERYQLHPNFLK